MVGPIGWAAAGAGGQRQETIGSSILIGLWRLIDTARTRAFEFVLDRVVLYATMSTHRKN
jgi:hypothetical protein